MQQIATQLPLRASLRHVKTQARDLLEAYKAKEDPAIRLFKELHPKCFELSPEQVAAAAFGLQDAQLVIAHHYGFSTWGELKQYIEISQRQRNRSDKLDSEYIQKVQYRDDSNLNARIEIHSRFTPPEKNIPKILWSQQSLKPDYRALDAGCGNGHFWISKFAKLPPETQLVLMDTSPGMLTAAREKLSHLSNPKDFVQGSLAKLPFSDNSFDSVNCHYVMHIMTNIPRAVAEIHRVLKPGAWSCMACIDKGNMMRINEPAVRAYPNIPIMDPIGYTGVADQVLEAAQGLFHSVKVQDYRCPMKVDDVEVIVGYAQSSPRIQSIDLPKDFWQMYRTFVATEVDEIGYYAIEKTAKILLCRKSQE